jgi:hypothetical protein
MTQPNIFSLAQTPAAAPTQKYVTQADFDTTLELIVKAIRTGRESFAASYKYHDDARFELANTIGKELAKPMMRLQARIDALEKITGAAAPTETAARNLDEIAAQFLE